MKNAPEKKRRRGRQAIGTAIVDLPSRSLNDLKRLAVATSLPVSEIDARLNLVSQGVGLSALQKYVGKLRRETGAGVRPGRSSDAGRANAAALALLHVLTVLCPDYLIDATIRRLAFLRHVDTDEISELAKVAGNMKRGNSE
ncbi:MAG TPA: hypothetical protein VNT79_10935 [Phycisphaerae bacterium]|nr:hypothetical protein [Phycisphaerae bacterium]